MISVTINTEGEIFSLKIVGHAGYAEHGADIVCAAASILASTVSSFVASADENGDLQINPQNQIDEGDVIISCVPNDDSLSSLQDMFCFAKRGFELLEYNYPQYVRLMP